MVLAAARAGAGEKQTKENPVNNFVVDENRFAALRLYKAPFRHENGYIFDKDGNTVADQAVHALRVRGWGRISKLKNPEQLEAAVGDMIAEALTEYWQRNIR